MPISPIVLQRRHAELGRIRLGQKVATGNGRSRPEKLDRFRFTSANQRLIDDIAELYGGTSRPWDNGGKAEHEVVTDARSIPVIVVRGGMSQWMETWSGGGCVHRCDGITNAITGEACDPDDRAHFDAKPTTRLSVMLRDVESLGVWRLESHGWNAAAELPMLAELAMHVGDLVPATLHLVERKAIRDGKTSRFVVPVLDLAVSKARLVEIAGGMAGDRPAEIDGPPPATPAIEAAPAPAPDYFAMVARADVDGCRDIWAQAGASGHLTETLKGAIASRVSQLDEVADQEAPTPATPSGDVDAAWMTLVTAAGQAGWSEPQLRKALEQEYAQPVEDLDAAQLKQFVGKVGAA